MGWKDSAKELYFMQHKKTTEIAKLLKKDRKTISAFLSAQEGYKEEKEYRKEANKEKRRKDKKEWDKNKRKTGSLGPDEKLILKRQHDIDVMILSAEKYS